MNNDLSTIYLLMENLKTNISLFAVITFLMYCKLYDHPRREAFTRSRDFISLANQLYRLDAKVVCT